MVTSKKTINLVILMVIIATFAAGLIGALSLEIGTLSKPGSGLWPAMCSVGGLGLTLAVAMIQSTRRIDEPSDELEEEHNWSKVLLFTIIGILFYVVYPYTGFLIASVPMTAVLLRFFGKSGWITTAVVAVVVPLSVYFVFSELLKVRL